MIQENNMRQSDTKVLPTNTAVDLLIADHNNTLHIDTWSLMCYANIQVVNEGMY